MEAWRSAGASGARAEQCRLAARPGNGVELLLSTPGPVRPIGCFILQLFLPGLSPVSGKTITATFDGGTLSSNGGVLILREIEKRLGLATVLSRHIPDDRDGRRVRHSYSDMTRARMFAIASGHEDCDDLDVLRSDPALKMRSGRLPVWHRLDVATDTLSRLETAPCWRQLGMAAELIDLFCARFCPARAALHRARHR